MPESEAKRVLFEETEIDTKKLELDMSISELEERVAEVMCQIEKTKKGLLDCQETFFRLQQDRNMWRKMAYRYERLFAQLANDKFLNLDI